MKLSLYFIIALSLLGLGCSHSPKIQAKRFVIEKNWVRNTYQTEYLGYRRAHRFTPVVDEDVLVVGNAVDGILAYDRKTGSELWKREITFGVEAGADYVDGIVYFGANDGFFYAVNVKTGSNVWKFPIRFEGIATPTIKNGVVYFVAGNNVAFALDAKTGKQKWLYNRRDPSSLSIRGGSKPNVYGSSVYIGFSDGYLVSLDKDTGKVQWEQLLNQNKRFRDVDASPIVENDRIYISSYDGALYCLNRDSGSIIWRVDRGSHSSVLIHDRTLFYSTSDGHIQAVDKVSGKVIWTKKIKEGVGTRPSFYRGLLVYGVSSGALNVLDATSGEFVGKYRPGRGVTSDPYVDRDTGEVYFLSADANVFALKMEWKPKVKTWPWED